MTDVRELDDLLYLIRCAVDRRKADPARVRGMNLERLYRLSRFHSLAALTYTAVESAWEGQPPRDAVPAGWEEARDAAIRNTLLFTAERKALESFCEEKGIWYLPLKGILLQEDYPGLGLREMADNDILFDGAFQAQIHDWFVARGYEVDTYRTGVHDSYHKPPVFNFEMHTALFGAATYPAWVTFFDEALERTSVREGTCRQRRFTPEDFYLYLLAHMYKHFTGSGTGLRSLLDLFLFHRAHGAALDREVLNRGLNRLELTEFDRQACALAERIFGSEVPLRPEEAEKLTDYLTSGTYGTVAHRLQSQLREIAGKKGTVTGLTKCRYLCRRFFPDRAFMELWCGREAPFFLHHPGLMPLAYGYRLVYNFAHGREKNSSGNSGSSGNSECRNGLFLAIPLAFDARGIAFFLRRESGCPMFSVFRFSCGASACRRNTAGRYCIVWCKEVVPHGNHVKEAPTMDTQSVTVTFSDEEEGKTLSDCLAQLLRHLRLEDKTGEHL